jgi:RNA 2',3'-cyclic 3'-phosphodiesterase
MPRLFIALEVPLDITRSLTLLKGGMANARWIDPENYHITLRFIGDVENHMADEIAAALDRIKCAPFDVSLSGVGEFGSKKPHSLYANVRPNVELNRLAADMERLCQRIGLPAEPRKFVPHITIARLKAPLIEDVAHYLSSRGNFSTAPFKISRFVLMSSKDSVGGGPYIVEENYPLAGRETALMRFDLEGKLPTATNGN